MTIQRIREYTEFSSKVTNVIDYFLYYQLHTFSCIIANRAKVRDAKSGVYSL